MESIKNPHGSSSETKVIYARKQVYALQTIAILRHAGRLRKQDAKQIPRGMIKPQLRDRTIPEKSYQLFELRLKRIGKL